MRVRVNLCLFQREINIFVQKKKKKILTDFFSDGLSLTDGRGRFWRKEKIRKWSSRMASRRFRVTYSTDRNWSSKCHKMTHELWVIKIWCRSKKRVYITKRGGDESLILDRQQISTGAPPENNFNGFDCYGILGIIQVCKVWCHSNVTNPWPAVAV